MSTNVKNSKKTISNTINYNNNNNNIKKSKDIVKFNNITTKTNNEMLNKLEKEKYIKNLIENGQHQHQHEEVQELKNLIIEEEHLKHIAEQSYFELLNTTKELERRTAIIEDDCDDFNNNSYINNRQQKFQQAHEGNEWKTRFENQEEINRHLSKQVVSLESKLEEIRVKFRNVKSKYYSDFNEFSQEDIDKLTRTRESLIAQLKDYGWRWEQENKAAFKANEERKELLQELQDARNLLIMSKESHLPPAQQQSQHQPSLTSQSSPNTNFTRFVSIVNSDLKKSLSLNETPRKIFNIKNKQNITNKNKTHLPRIHMNNNNNNQHNSAKTDMTLSEDFIYDGNSIL